MWLNYQTFALYAIISLNFAIINATPASTKERPAVTACRDYSRNLKPELKPHIASQYVDLGEYPHMAAIGYKDIDSDNYVYRCGATLIAKRFLLTTAVCVSQPLAEPAVVRLNFTDFKDAAQEFIEIPVKKIHLHPDHVIQRFYDDIALIEVENDIPFSETCRPACLFTDKEPSANDTLYAVGFMTNGKNSRPQLSDKFLRYTLKLTTNDICNDMYESFKTRRLSDGIRETQLCAQATDSCAGPAGIPLVVDDGNKQIFSVVGVHSGGVSCGTEFPEIFTRVSSYLDFIENIVWPEHL